MKEGKWILTKIVAASRQILETVYLCYKASIKFLLLLRHVHLQNDLGEF